jgi:hypothetical protein
MAGVNFVKNTTLLSMLQEAEKAQSTRLQQRMRQSQEAAVNRQPFTPPSRVLPSNPQEGDKILTPEKSHTTAGDGTELREEVIPLTLDEIEWLDSVVGKHGHADFSGILSRLVDWANTEAPESKKKLFLVIRCRRCSAGAKGGVKWDRNIELTSRQWQWIENVRQRSHHASIGKTLRIIVDFYMPLCKDDAEFEQKVLRAGSTLKTDRHVDAVNSVDPRRALAIQGWRRQDEDSARKGA